MKIYDENQLLKYKDIGIKKIMIADRFPEHKISNIKNSIGSYRESPAAKRFF